MSNKPLHPTTEAVLRTALLGTGRDGQTLQLEGALQPFGTSGDNLETALLNSAAAVTLCEKAGALPPQGRAESFEASPAETQPYFSERSAMLLALCMETHRDLSGQALSYAAASGRIAPPPMLPPLLELGKGSRGLRRHIAPILGERGRWLAQLNPAWKSVAAPQSDDLHETFQNGETAARREALTLQRQIEPATARAWLEADFKKEAARERAEWIQVLADGLSDQDEPFLESALDDKSKEVRAEAISQLERLPDSRLVQRAKAELETLLQWTGKGKTLLVLQKAGNLQVELPEAWKPEWARDGLQEQVPPHLSYKKMGQKASWLRHFVSRVPPAHWEERFELSAAKILAGTPKEWQELLFTAWWEAAVTHGAAEWSLALLDAADAETLRQFSFQGLSPEHADALAAVLLQKTRLDDVHRESPLAQLMQAHPGPYGSQVGSDLLALVRGLIKKSGNENVMTYNSPSWWLRMALVNLADKLPIELAAQAAQGWPDDEFFQENWAAVVSQFAARLQLRADLASEFRPIAP